MSLLSQHFGPVFRAAPSSQAQIEDIYAKLTIAAAVFFITLELAIVALGGMPSLDRPWLDGMEFVVGRDFLNTWMGARSFFSGGPAPWFDFQVYNEALQKTLGIPYPPVYWSYPPHILLFVWPLGLLPYLPAYFVWCAVGIGFYLFVCSFAVPRQQLFFVALAPPVALCIFFGQNGFYTSALFIGGMLCRERRPILAGVLFGVLTIKPQIGLLLPVVLLVERRWVTIASAIATVAALVTLTALLFGWNIWIDFYEKIIPQQVWLTESSKGLLFALVGSVFFGVRMMYLPNGVAWFVQYTVAALAVGAVAWTYWKRRDPKLSLPLLVSAVFLATPYILTYDMVMLGFVVALLRGRSDNTMADHYLMIAVWALPVAMMFAAVICLPLAPIVLIAFAGRLLWRLVQDSKHENATLPEPAAIAAA